MGEARDVVVTLEGKPISEIAVQGQGEAKIIGPRSSIGYLVGTNFQFHPPWVVEVKWPDDTGESKHYRHTLTVVGT